MESSISSSNKTQIWAKQDNFFKVPWSTHGSSSFITTRCVSTCVVSAASSTAVVRWRCPAFQCPISSCRRSNSLRSWWEMGGESWMASNIAELEPGDFPTKKWKFGWIFSWSFNGVRLHNLYQPRHHLQGSWAIKPTYDTTYPKEADMQ